MPTKHSLGVPGGSVVKNPPASAGDTGSVPESGRSPRGRNGSPSGILVCEIPWSEEPGGLQSTGSPRVGRDLVTKEEQ